MDEIAAHVVEMARRGEERAAPFLVSLLGEKLLGYARAHAPDLSDLAREAIVEQAIESGSRTLDRFDPAKGSLYGWFRLQVRYRTLTWRRDNPIVGELPTELVDAAVEPSPDEDAVGEALSRAIQSLSHDDQKIIALRDAEQLDYAEIAQRLGLRADTARQRHHRARERLYRQVKADPILAAHVKEDQR